MHVAAPAAHVALAVGPFVALPDDDKRETVTHFCPPGLEKPLSDTVRFFHQPYDLYEQYLEANFPYPSLQQVYTAYAQPFYLSRPSWNTISYDNDRNGIFRGAATPQTDQKSPESYTQQLPRPYPDTKPFTRRPHAVQVFVPAGSVPRSSQVAAGLHIASAHLLVAPRVLTQGAECRIRLARALAQQWFGSFMMPESAADAWVTEGLAAFLTDLCVAKLLGSPEVQWRRYHERRAVVAADNGVLPPLHPREGQVCVHQPHSCIPGSCSFDWSALSMGMPRNSRTGIRGREGFFRGGWRPMWSALRWRPFGA